MKYNPQFHHRRSIRLKGYDYSQEGLYFITLCIQDRECLFGKIADGEMILNDAGKIATGYWLQIPQHFPDVILHEYVIMPNHVHGIIELKNNAVVVGAQNVGVQNVGAQNFVPLRGKRENKFQKIIARSVGSIVRGYKIGVTKWFRNNATTTAGVQNTGAQNFVPLRLERSIWQRNYYEHIIRNEQSYETISDYIIHNPANWKDDKFYTT